MENTVSRNELGNDHISAVFFAQPAKNGIRYSGHWHQIESNLFRTKPRKHGGAASRRLQMTNRRWQIFAVFHPFGRLVFETVRSATAKICYFQSVSRR